MEGLPADAKEAVTENRRRWKKSGDDRKREPKGVRLAKGTNTAVQRSATPKDDSPSVQR